MKAATSHNYRKRLIKVVDYIYHNLEGDLDVNTLAEIALLSPYHFHRIYRQMAGETINACVRRLRLQRAATELITSDLPLASIANKINYSSLEAFSRAFRKEFSETPSDYRSHRRNDQLDKDQAIRNFVAMLPQPSKETSDMYKVEMIESEQVQLIGYEHQGDYMQVGNAFGKLFMYAGSNGLIGPNTRSIGLYYADPKSVAKEELRAAACLSVDSPFNSDDQSAPNNFSIPAGTCASVLFKGSYAELEKPYDWLFGEWLPNSGHEATDFPPFEEYLNDPKSTPPSELLTRIHCLLA